MIRPTVLNIVRFLLSARRPVTGQLTSVVVVFTHDFTVAMQAAIGLWTTLTLVLFVQLADESRRLSHQVPLDSRDDLPETFAASSWFCCFFLEFPFYHSTISAVGSASCAIGRNEWLIES